LWYGSLLPRFVSNLYSILEKRRPYRTYTYSIYGYEKLLKEVGFANNSYYGLFQGYTHLTRAIPLKTNSKYLVNTEPPNIKQKLKETAYFVPAYGIVAKKSNKVSTCFLDRVIDKVSEKTKLNNGSSITIDNFIVSGKDKLILFAQLADKKFVIKIPMNIDVDAAEKKNREFIVSFDDPVINAYLPIATAMGEYQGVNYYIEEHIEGRPIEQYISDGNDRDFLAKVENYFHKVSECNNFKKIRNAHETMKPSISSTLNDLLEILDEKQVYSTLEHCFLSQMADKEIGVGVYHGDFSVTNLLVAENGVMRIIDWESSKLQGFPIVDAINLVESALRVKNGSYTLLDTIRLLKDNKIPRIYQEFLGNCYKILGTDQALHANFVNLYWLNHITSQINAGLQYDVKAIETKVLMVMQNIISDCSVKN